MWIPVENPLTRTREFINVSDDNPAGRSVAGQPCRLRESDTEISGVRKSPLPEIIPASPTNALL